MFKSIKIATSTDINRNDDQWNNQISKQLMEKSKAISSFLSSYKSTSFVPSSSSAVTIKETKGSSGVKTKKHSDGKNYVHKKANALIYDNYK